MRERKRRSRMGIEFLCAFLAGGALAACAPSHVSVEAAGLAATRETPAPGTTTGTPGRTAADVKPSGASEAPVEFTVKVVITSVIPGEVGMMPAWQATCRGVPRAGEAEPEPLLVMKRVGCFGFPIEDDMKMTGVPGKYIVDFLIDGPLRGTAEFELLPSGSTYPQVLEVKVGPPEW